MDIQLQLTIAGGAIAILGSVPVTFIIHYLSHRNDVKKLKREKLEALTIRTYECEVWLANEVDYRLFDKQKTTPEIESPHTFVKSYSAIYFPELMMEEANALETAITDYKEFVIKKSLAKKKGPTVGGLDGFKERFNPIYQKVLRAIMGVEKKVQLIAVKLL